MEVKKTIHQLLQNFYIKNIIWAIGIILVLVIALMIWLNIYTLHNESITVPDLRGLTVEKAEQILKNKNLRYEVVDSVFVKGKAPGAIVEQIPAPESNVKEGRIVFLSINAVNAKKVLVPDVRDQSSRQAIATLTAVGFEVGNVVEVPSEYKDLVVDIIYRGQRVLPGQKLPMGGKLILNIGNGLGAVSSDSTKEVEKVENTEESWF
jgi:beta-lactam-binding protein with PASTA domain